jgi:hypothetical protein
MEPAETRIDMDRLGIAAECQTREKRTESGREAEPRGETRDQNGDTRDEDHQFRLARSPLERQRQPFFPVAGECHARARENPELSEQQGARACKRLKQGCVSGVAGIPQDRHHGQHQCHQDDAGQVVELGHVGQKLSLPALQRVLLPPHAQRHADAGRGQRDGRDQARDLPVAEDHRHHRIGGHSAERHVARPDKARRPQLFSKRGQIAFETDAEKQHDDPEFGEKFQRVIALLRQEVPVLVGDAQQHAQRHEAHQRGKVRPVHQHAERCCHGDESPDQQDQRGYGVRRGAHRTAPVAGLVMRMPRDFRGGPRRDMCILPRLPGAGGLSRP